MTKEDHGTLFGGLIVLAAGVLIGATLWVVGGDILAHRQEIAAALRDVPIAGWVAIGGAALLILSLIVGKITEPK